MKLATHAETCNEAAPEGSERLYTDGLFFTGPDICEDYGHDVMTGNSFSEMEFRALNPQRRAILKPATCTPPHEAPNDEYPLQLLTGRTVYHFHTRTKTGRAPELVAAAPEVWVELATADAAKLDIGEGALCEVASPRGSIEARARVTGSRVGVAFIPFHYGYWDAPDDRVRGRAANELTMTIWDPVSKQPLFKSGAVRVTKLADATGPAPAPTIGAAAPA